LKRHKTARVETFFFEPETEGVLPAQAESHPLLGSGIGTIFVVPKEHREHHTRRRETGSAFGGSLE
jgi:hypothetical protein